MHSSTHIGRSACPLALAFVLTWFAGPPACAATVYVNGSASGATHDGTSWAKAFLTVQAGVTAAAAGDEVWVARGTYIENVTLKDGSAMYGGFAGTETTRSQRNVKANETVLDGGGTADAVLAPSSAVLDGFSVRNATNGYAGLRVTAGTATVRGCTFTGNANGISADAGTASVASCVFSANDAGIYIASRGTANVTNCTFSMDTYGIYLRSGTLTVVNSILAYNFRGIYRYIVTDSVGLSHNDVFGSTMENYKNLDDPTGTFGNIRQDPVFVDAGNGDFHVGAGSPCIDAGDARYVAPDATDLDGRPRIFGGQVDMGAFEYGAVPYTLQDAAGVLRISAGLATATSADLALLNAEPGSAGIDLADAIRIARKAAGLEPNP